MVFVGIEEKW